MPGSLVPGRCTRARRDRCRFGQEDFFPGRVLIGVCDSGEGSIGVCVLGGWCRPSVVWALGALMFGITPNALVPRLNGPAGAGREAHYYSIATEELRYGYRDAGDAGVTG